MHVRAFSLRLAGKWKEALNYINIILKVHPNSPKVLELRTHLIKAPEIEKELLEETDDIDLLINRAVYVNSTLMNNYLGIEYADKALKISPDSVIAWTFKANAHLGIDEYDKSLLSFEKALKLKGDDFVLWGGKGFALLGKDNYEEAINCFDKALKLNPDEDLIQKARQKALIDLEQQKKKKGVPSMADLAGSMKTLVDQITEEIEDNYEGRSPFASLDSFQKFKNKMFFDHINSEEAKKSIEIPEEFKKIAVTIKSSRVKDLKVRKALLSKLKVQDFSDEISKFPKSKSNKIHNAMTLLLRR